MIKDGVGIITVASVLSMMQPTFCDDVTNQVK